MCLTGKLSAYNKNVESGGGKAKVRVNELKYVYVLVCPSHKIHFSVLQNVYFSDLVSVPSACQVVREVKQMTGKLNRYYLRKVTE